LESIGRIAFRKAHASSQGKVSPPAAFRSRRLAAVPRIDRDGAEHHDLAFLSGPGISAKVLFGVFFVIVVILRS